jgi:hypothetical protein
MMKKGMLAAMGMLLLSGTALADEYRRDVFAANYSELQINFADSQYNNQVWQRPGRQESLKYHDTLIIMFAPGCVWLQTGAPPPNTDITDTMFYFSYSNDSNNNEWGWLDDDSGHAYLSTGYLRFESGGERRVRVRTTGYDANINSQRVDISMHHMPLSECPSSGGNVVIL